MGVTGLWQIVQPCARPIKIETLNRKRLAVDASIWIYQFLKAVRDKEGNALRNSHVVGFFRRICKLLFFGIKPVFVFDGGAPALKRQTINARKSRREGRREDAVRTAGKLLAVQMQRRAEEEEARRKADRVRRPEEEEEVVAEENLVYVDEIQMTPKERQQNRKFRKKDAYHLPDLDMSVSEMGGPNDPRIMSLEDLQEYARQFNSGEDINVYDFSKIDYDGPFFTSLPASDRYNILNAARLRSRLRMGHSKEQLDTMFPDRMAFSRFQIERVTERNELTQRLMHLNGAGDTTFGLGRVAGEKGREYVLIKNDGVEGGWALGVISDEGKEEKPIELDRSSPITKNESDEEWDDEEHFEDVPIEGLNRLPKVSAANSSMDRLMRKRKSLYKSRQSGARRNARAPRPPKANESLFVQESDGDDGAEDDVDDDGANEDLFGDDAGDNADEELQRAIAMSLEKDGDVPQTPSNHSEEEDDMLEVFQQQAVPEQMPLPTGSGRAIANIVNRRAYKAAPESREITSFGVPVPKPDVSDDDDTMDFRAALAESRRTKHKTSPLRLKSSPSKPVKKPVDNAKDLARQAGFSGPLPFEKLDLGTSLLGKAKMKQREEDTAGGFENPELEKNEKKMAGPLPPWFAGDIEKDLSAQKALEREDREQARAFAKQFQFQSREGGTLHRSATKEVIDLDADDADERVEPVELIDLDEDSPRAESNNAAPADDLDVKMDIRQGAPAPDALLPEGNISQPDGHGDKEIQAPGRDLGRHTTPTPTKDTRDADVEADAEDDASIAWSESQPDEGREVEEPDHRSSPPIVVNEASDIDIPGLEHRSIPADEADADVHLRSPSPTFEDVAIPDEVIHNDVELPVDLGAEQETNAVSGALFPDEEEFDDFSDPEEQEMLKALTQEAEEHARFASSLNNKPQAQNVKEYEQELKQLRNQQRKDRRDADEVTHVMITECQQLLSLFGLPYVTAPMEAEAQCAELVRLGLVDGIVTDDSDCFLFGGTRIYKNMFNQAKFVECYLSSDLEKEFGFTRNKMISIAQLLGSDYTEGLPGVGPVTALEIISEFESLDAFKDWYSAVQMNQIPKSEDADNPFRKKFRRNAQKLFLPTAFPDARVGLAYTEPEVDSDPEMFQWGVPDLDALRSFLMTTIGWSQERTDEILLPVIKDMNRRIDEGTQANITAFFEGSVGTGTVSSVRGEAFAPRKRAEGSKRMGNALKRMAEHTKRRQDTVPDSNIGHGAVGSPEADAADAEAATSEAPKPRKKRVRTAAPSDDDDVGSEVSAKPKKQAKSRRRANATLE